MRGLLRDLRQVVVGGHGDPPVPVAGFWRGVVRAGLWLAAILVALFALDLVWRGAQWYPGEIWHQLPTSLVMVWVLSAAPLAVLGYRPLLAWRLAWVLALVGLVISETTATCPPGQGRFWSDFDPLNWTIEWSCGPRPWFPGQVFVLGVVLAGVGAAQRRGVLLWVWLATAGLILASTDSRSGPPAATNLGETLDALVAYVGAAGLLLGGYLCQRWLRVRERAVVEPSRAAGALTSLRDRLRRTRLHGWLTDDLWRAVAGGPDEPPALGPTTRIRRYVRYGLWSAAFLVALAAASAAADGEDPAQQVLWPLSTVPLAVVIYRPLLAWRCGWVLGLLSLLAAAPESDGFHWSPALIWAMLAVLFVVGTGQPPGVLVWVWLATVPLVLPAVERGGRPAAVIVVAGVLVAGYQVQRRRQARHHLAEAQERGTVLTERARIARELHDVVAHHMSMIAVRTETAPYRLGDLPERARTEFAEISQASREALTEMRRLLGVLRSEEPAPLTAPQPGIADLPELVASARAAGTDVTIDVDATLPELPAAVDVSAYRIVQEALTNAARHALGAPVRVVVGRSAGGLALSVRNGSGRVPGQDAAPGHGVRGMRERVAMLGGQLRAGPDGDGGFEVSAVLPLQVS